MRHTFSALAAAGLILALSGAAAHSRPPAPPPSADAAVTPVATDAKKPAKPKPRAARTATKPKPGAAATSVPAPAPAASGDGARPVADWRGAAVTAESGALAYCVTENRFDNGLVLVIGRSAQGETNLAIGIPKAGMKTGQRWKVKVEVDGSKLRREREAVAAESDLVVIALGKDDAMLEAMTHGRKLELVGPTDTAGFQLKGTGKALADLRKCVDTGGKSAGRQAASRPKPGGGVLPEALAAILAAAGLDAAAPLSLANVPEDKRPADYAWRHGPVFGGVRETEVPENRADIAALSKDYIEALKQRCTGDFNHTFTDIEKLPGVSLRNGAVDCMSQQGKIHVALTFYLTQTRLFTVFFHEAPEAERATADRARDGITAVIRKLAVDPPPAPPPPRS